MVHLLRFERNRIYLQSVQKLFALKLFATIAAILLCIASGFAQITVTPGVTPEAIVENLIGNGVQVSNVVINCSTNAYGTFTGNLGAGGVGLSNGGVVLTTGSAQGAEGPNTIGSAGAMIPGFDFADPQLTTQPGSGNPPPSEDNCIIEFDMIPSCGNITLAFVFGSEEYPEFVTGAFNDGFGIFVSGPNPAGGNYTSFNMARLPNGQLVSIDNVNINNNAAFYNTNTLGIMQYDGYTDGLLASINTVPCASYSIKIIIADAGDESYDSGLFLGFQSFQCGTPPFTVTPTITNSVCGADGAASVAVSGGVGPFAYSWSGVSGQATNTNSINNISAGTYSVTIIDQGQCDAEVTTQITITGSQPVLTASAVSSALCQGQSTTITAANGSSYSWSPSAGLSSTLGATVTATPSISTTYTVTSTLNGCTQTVNVPITVTPVPSLTIDDAPICQGQTASLTAVPSVGGGNFTWTPGNLTGSTINVSPTTTTTYTSQYVLNGCASTPVSATVTVSPVPTFTLSNPAICEGESATIVSTTTFSGGTFSWSTGDNTPNINVSPSVTTTYSATYTLNNCTSSSVNSIVTVNPFPVSTITTNSPVCEGSTLTLTTNVTTGATYSWIGPNGFSSSSQNPSITALPLEGDGTYTLTVTASNCTSDFTMEVQVIPVTSSTASPSGPHCINADLIDLTSSLEPGVWSGDGIVNSTSGSFDPTIAGVGNHVITFDSDALCTEPFNFTIEVFEQFDATISPVNPLCNNAAPITLTAADPNGTWSGDGVTNLGIINPSSLSPGTYEATYTISGACGNSNTLSFDILPVPDGTIFTSGPFCQVDLPQTLTATSSGGTWNGLGVINTANGTFGSPTLAADTYTISYTIGGQCGGTWTRDIIVNENINATISNPPALCSNSGPYQFMVTNAGGTWTGSGAITQQGVINPAVLGAGTYTFSYSFNNSGCLSSDDVSVQINAITPISFETDLTEGCTPLAVQFSNSSSSFGSNCIWSVDGLPVGSGCNDFSFTFTNGGCFDVGLTSTDANGCVSSFTLDDIVCAISPPAASFSWSPTIPSAENPEVVFTNLSVGNLANNWTINMQSFSDENPSYSVPLDVDETFQACLRVTGEFGCSSQICNTIAVDRQEFVFVPNSFSPDGDGINDVFLPIISGLDENNPDYVLRIFNRWGDVVFESVDYNEPWIGDVKGGDHFAADGMYYWTLQVKLREREATKELQGYLFIIR